jgi:hypothetical protein
MYYLNLNAHDMTTTKIYLLKDGASFALSKRSKVSYRLDTIEKSQAVITSLSSGRTYHKSKKTVCYIPNEGQLSNYTILD